MKTLPSLLVLLLPGVLAAADPPVMPGLPPSPRAEPLSPQAGEAAAADPHERTTALLEERLRELDRRIAALQSRFGDRVPAVDARLRAGLEDEQTSRDQAWRRLQEVLEAGQDRTVTRRTDILDTPAGGDDALRRSLEAANALKVAECHLLLVEQTSDPAKRGERLKAGEAAVSTIDAERLTPVLRPRLRACRLAFVCEDARLVQGEARSARLVEARRLLDEFATQHPDSALLTAARERVASLETLGGSKPGAAP